MINKKYIIYIFFLLFCLLFTNCEFLGLLFNDLFIDEPPDGLETTENLITVKGHGINKEINEVELLFNDSFVDLKQVERDDEDEDEDYCSFEFLNVFVPTGDIKIEVIGYSDWTP